ncbi:MAG: DUF1980 domain-containing protein [Akkermansiaceae bacterium]|nr:DUF1980 domain-containing protein [Akkermansiaceae bacterium]MCP5546578.1 DUF1980 domain-containing protein [Akkermansiaceae bacterium]
MNPVARRILFSLAILGWGAVLLYFHSSGRITKYLAPDFRPIALSGGLGLAVLGLFNLFYCRVSTTCGHDHGDGGACHDHEAPDLHPLAILLLMLLPVGLAVAWTKDEYSASTLARKGLYETPASTPTFLAGSLPALTREEIEKSHSKTPDGYYEFSLMELFYSTGDRDLQNAINGLKVETEGRWVDEKVRNPNGTRKRLYRLFITCCAADSRAVPIILEFGKTPPNQQENGWVKVAGTMTFPLEEGIIQPVLRVDRVLAAEPPYEESFLRN